MKKIIVITVSFFLFIYLSVIAQEVKIKEKKLTKDSIPEFILFDTDVSAYMKGQEGEIWKKFLKTTTNDKFVKATSHFDEQGMEHIVYQQYYKNIKVEYATYRVHIKNGKI